MSTSDFQLKAEKSSLRFLSNCFKLCKAIATEEFGFSKANDLKIIFSRKLYFTLGLCWPERNQISFNLAWLVMHKSKPEDVRDLLIHELMHMGDRTHGESFQRACAKYGVIEGSTAWGEVDYLPAASWVICTSCGDTQGLLFRARLTPEQAGEKLTNVVCRTCGHEIEYRELSDKAFKNLSTRVRKLRLYDTKSWKALKALTGQ